MNATQRKFLIERIQKKVNERISELSEMRLKYPSASNYIFKAVLNDQLEIQPKEVILRALKKKALNAKEGANWLSDERMGFDKESTIRVLIEELILIPTDYRDELNRVKDHNKTLNLKINELKIQLDTIEMRIQLASDKTLQKLINEVDDMGDLSLMDTKLKSLN